MEYEEYLTKYPGSYQKFSKHMNRTENLYRHMQSLALFDNVRTLLSIGAGEGELELKIMNENKLLLTYLDPAHLFYKNFLNNVEKLNLSKQLAHAYNSAYETFKTQEKFDLIISIHSWYPFGFALNILEKTLSICTDRGKVFINLASDKSPVAKISALSASKGIQLTSERLSEWATQSGYPHQYSIEHNLRPTALYFQQNELTEAGQDFVSFLMAIPWQELSTQLQMQTTDIVKEHIQGENIDICSGCLLLEKHH